MMSMLPVTHFLARLEVIVNYLLKIKILTKTKSILSHFNSKQRSFYKISHNRPQNFSIDLPHSHP